MKTIKEFYLKIDRPDENGCMRWRGALLKSGYGTLSWKGKPMTSAHRLSYQLSFGEIPKGMIICHKCDNTWCVSPFHLFLGTQKDNILDAVKKGRHHLKKGIRLNSKLTEIQVSEIRKRIKKGEIMGVIAKLYNVTAQQISKINTGERWASTNNDKDKQERMKIIRINKSKREIENHSKLNEHQVREIRIKLALGQRQRDIGNDYGVSQYCIYSIKHGKSWTHI